MKEDLMNVYLSYSWNYVDQLKKVKAMLPADFTTCGVKKGNPAVNAFNEAPLVEAVKGEMEGADVLLIYADSFFSYQKVVNVELAQAKAMNKKVVVVTGGGVMPAPVKKAAAAVVKYDAASILEAL
jgi:hypothetical protein